MTDQEIWHGDSRLLAADIPGEINCIITDPPFGADFVSRRAVTPQGKAKNVAIADDSDLVTAALTFLQTMEVLIPKLAQDSDVYVFTRWDIVDTWMSLVRQLGLQYKMLLIWDKGIPGMGDIDCNWGCGHELILYCKKGRREMPYRRSSIIHVDKIGSGKNIHPTEKPVELLMKLIEMSTSPGDLVVDPFSGSGSTVVAAQRLGRRAIGIEVDERYIAKSRSRLTELAFQF